MATIRMPDLEKNEVSIDGEVIFVRLAGKQSKILAQKTLDAFKSCIQVLKQKGHKVFVLVDYQDLKVSDVSTASRLAIKEAFGQPYEALAAVGKSQLDEVTLYLMKAGGARGRAKHFTSERKARRWLAEAEHPRHKRNNNMLVIASIVGMIGALSLLGWIINNQTLIRFIPDMRAINPLGALGLLILSAAFISIWLGRTKLTLLAAILLITLGVAAILPLPIDTILFADRLRALDTPTLLADSAGICFIALGISFIALRATRRVAMAARMVLAGIILLLALFNIFGILYASEVLYGISSSFTMAFNLSLGIAVAGVGLIFLLRHGQNGSMTIRVSRLGWLLVTALILVQVITYISWRQSIERNRNDAQSAFDDRSKELKSEIQNRVQTYTDALYGFKGLFAASNGVNEAEFQAYYRTLGLAEKYPGIRTISFISAVDGAELPAFIAERRRDTSINPGGNPAFTIQGQSAGPQHYILTYVANTPGSASQGRDFADDSVRRATYEKAIKTGKPAVSNTLTFAATASTPETKGFFITIPLKAQHTKLEAGDTYTGFVSAIFYYSEFFASAFSSPALLEEVKVQVSDTTSSNMLFSSDKTRRQKTMLSYTDRIVVADRTWTIAVDAPPAFGTSESQNNLPPAVLSGGQIVALLLIIIFWIQNRARERALRLADDITADLQYERNQALSLQQKDDAILSSIGDAVFAIDTKERLTLFNPSAQKISGFTEKEAIGKHYADVLEFVFEATGKTNNSFVKKALSGKNASMENHTILIRKDGGRVPVADSAAPIYDANGKLVGAIIVFRDVSKEYELDRAKTEFVSLASHQLRTPLSAISWYTEMLLHGDAGTITPDQQLYLKEIYEGNQRMVELVNSLLDVSRLDLGKLSNEPVRNNIPELIDSLHKELATSITSKNLTVRTTVASNLKPVVADPKLTRMILQNLLSNAVKYTPDQGSIIVTARPATDAEIDAAGITMQPCLFFSVKDTGFGIPAAQQPKIFSKLFRADNVRAMDVEGTGLGLYIVKEVVEKLGGRVWFESIESMGSTFFVILPFTTKSRQS